MEHLVIFSCGVPREDSHWLPCSVALLLDGCGLVAYMQHTADIAKGTYNRGGNSSLHRPWEANGGLSCKSPGDLVHYTRGIPISKNCFSSIRVEHTESAKKSKTIGLKGLLFLPSSPSVLSHSRGR